MTSMCKSVHMFTADSSHSRVIHILNMGFFFFLSFLFFDALMTLLPLWQTPLHEHKEILALPPTSVTAFLKTFTTWEVTSVPPH